MTNTSSCELQLPTVVASTARADDERCVDPVEPQIRILHVLGGMDRGGVETWLMHVLRNIDRRHYQMDFLVHNSRPCAYDEEILGLGSKIYIGGDPRRPLQYAKSFLRILRQQGPYQVVHSHVHHFSGFVMLLAAAASVRYRISHSHNDTRNCDASGRPARKVYLSLCRRWIQKYSSLRLASSSMAAVSLFGPSWAENGSTKILNYGCDFSSFTAPVHAPDVRRELGLSGKDFVVGHVGRFAEQKNHHFLLLIHKELLQQNPDTHLLLIGIGPLEQSVRQAAVNLGTIDKVHFAGLRGDIARVMIGAMDCFVFPSLHEGLGLAALEAQAAGLPTFLSTQVPAEADAGCGLVKFLDLAAGPEHWAEQVVKTPKPKSINFHTAHYMSTTHFSIDASIEALCGAYGQCS